MPAHVILRLSTSSSQQAENKYPLKIPPCLTPRHLFGKIVEVLQTLILFENNCVIVSLIDAAGTRRFTSWSLIRFQLILSKAPLESSSVVIIFPLYGQLRLRVWHCCRVYSRHLLLTTCKTRNIYIKKNEYNIAVGYFNLYPDIFNHVLQVTHTYPHPFSFGGPITKLCGVGGVFLPCSFKRVVLAYQLASHINMKQTKPMTETTDKKCARFSVFGILNRESILQFQLPEFVYILADDGFLSMPFMVLSYKLGVFSSTKWTDTFN